MSLIKKLLPVGVLASLASTAFAQAADEAADAAPVVVEAVEAGTTTGKGLAVMGGGLAVFGAAIGIGLIGKAATESMARQPEVAGKVQTAAIILAVFIEGATLFGVAAGFIA